MSYEKQGFVSGNKLYAAQLVAMEEGILENEANINAANAAAAVASDNAAAAVNDAASALEAATTAAENASSALSAANTASSAAAVATAAAEELSSSVEELAGEVDDLKENGTGSGSLEDIGQLGLTEEDGVLYIIDTTTGEHGGEGWEVTGTGSGSSSSGSTKLKLTSGTTATIPEGNDYTITWTFTSTDEDGDETGDGTAVLTLNDSILYQASISQGDGSYTIAASQLVLGSNSISLAVTDADGKTLTRSCTVKTVSLSISSSFDDSVTYSEAVTFRYTPVGSGLTKTIHFVLDGVEIDTAEVSSTGRQQTYTIPMQSYGVHTFLVYATATIDGSTATSNELYYEIGFTDDTGTDPFITCNFQSGQTVKEGTILEVKYLAYDPAATTTSVTREILREDGSVYYSGTATVDRTQQTWTINDYPTGEITLRLTCGTATKTISLTVTASDLGIEVSTGSQVYYLSAISRSNSDDDKGSADYGDITATLSNFNYASDGWQGTTLRFQGDDTLEIAYQPFAKDVRSTGFTMEFEFTTIAERDKDAVIISCMSGGRGFEITPQSATYVTEQSSKTIYFKEKERTRITIAAESLTEDRMVRLCVNGVPYGEFQYPTGDNLQQSSAVNITIGNEDCSFDLHTVRLHTVGLNGSERIGNWIYDRDTYDERAELAEMNDIYDDYGELDPDKVEVLLPCGYVTGTKSTGKKDYQDIQWVYHYTSDAARSFSDALAYWYIQGTSSVGFPVKNWRIQLSEGYELYEDTLEQTLYCLKANFMDSSGACNTGAANLFHYIYRQMGYLTPPMEQDENVRMCISGYPFILWWRETENDEYEFEGIYTFNYDKGSGTEGLYGAEESAWPGVQWWEFCNNTSGHCLFTSADIDDDISTDLEVRYGEENWDIISNAIQFVINCAGDAATFVESAEEYFNLNYLIMYYILSEVLGMTDSRAKNMMMAVWPSVSKQLYAIWYDMDTMAGRNNEGIPTFPYDMEAHSQYGTAMAYNGEGSALWKLVEEGYPDLIKTTYQTLRSKGYLSEETIRTYMVEPFYGTIPASLYVEDGVRKYEKPTLEDGDDQLTINQGDWAMYFLRWVALSLAYRDSKYNATQYTSDTISLRIYSPSTDNITDSTTKALVEASLAAVPPDQDFDISCDIHYFAGVLYGANGYQVQEECEEGGTVHITAPSLSNYNDLETYVQGMAKVTDIGDLAPKYPGSVNLSAGVLLRTAYLGSRISGYYNTNLTEVTFGNNTMLEIVVLSNSPNLAGNIDLSNAPALEEFYAEGTAISSVSFSNGGRLKILYLPETITSLDLRNQPYIETLDMAGYDGLTTLRVENCPTLDVLTIVEAAANLERVRLTDVDWTMNSSSTLTRLAATGGLDANGANTDIAIVTGKAYVDSIGATALATLEAAFPDLEITYGSLEDEYTLTFCNADGTVLWTETIERGQDGYDPVASGDISTPTQASSVDTDYTFAGWSGSYTYVTGDVTLTAVYLESVRSYTVKFKNGAVVVQTSTVEVYGSVEYTGDDLYKDGYIWTGWDTDTSYVTSDLEVSATFATPSLPTTVLDTSEYDYVYSDDETDSSAYTFGEFIAIINAGLADTYFNEYDAFKIVNTGSVIKDESMVYELHSTGHFELADGSGDMANTTWFMKGVLTNGRAVNSTNTNVGGFLESALDDWLENTLYPSFPVKWRNVIKPVYVLANAGDQGTAISTGTRHLTIPSWAELGIETSAVPYKNEVSSAANELQFSKYTSNSQRIKYTYNGEGSAQNYWTRSAYAGSSVAFCGIYTNGYSYNSNASDSYFVCVGLNI